MIKLYGLYRVEEKQRWKPVFWYCVDCKKVVSRIDNAPYEEKRKYLKHYDGVI